MNKHESQILRDAAQAINDKRAMLAALGLSEHATMEEVRARIRELTGRALTERLKRNCEVSNESLQSKGKV